MGTAMIGGLYAAWAGRAPARRALQVVGFSVGIAAVGYAWTVIPLGVGGIVVWYGIRERRLYDELAQHNAHRATSHARASL
jgi:hypothetical protein